MSSSKQQMIVSEDQSGMRLDLFLVDHLPEYSRSKIRTAISDGQVLVDQKTAKPSYRLNENQAVDCDISIQADPGPEPEDIPLDIIFDEENFVVINKPPRMVVHPAKGHWSGTLTSALAFRFQNLSSYGGQQRPGIVHRLDRDTSGVIVVAKNDAAHMHLAKQFENRTVEKEYFAVVSPVPDRERDWIDEPIGIHPYQREKMTTRGDHTTSREAKTFYEVLQTFKPTERGKPFAAMKLQPRTGRTHQLRVHLQHIGCPVVADKLYSGKSQILRGEIRPIEASVQESSNDGSDSTESESTEKDSDVIIDRQALHACRLKFSHPVTNETLEFKAPMPDDITRLLTLLEKSSI